MEIVEKNKVTIFRYDGQYGANYSLGLSKKLSNGTYENGYMPCKFKKDVELKNQTQIYIKNAWLSFNTKDKKTYPYIFINEFTSLEQAMEASKPEPVSDPYQDFADEINPENLELPF